ncbi:Hypothetical predicted protein [Pelobates cultripes]|uniref:Uncharacterized protein n=1 Tax=Pelobates cultripes TaxID=61616 RepID=A0AAD1VP25_PELCU|nr:Hypothetical predicted protein [Pelobates cultripes]
MPTKPVPSPKQQTLRLTLLAQDQPCLLAKGYLLKRKLLPQTLDTMRGGLKRAYSPHLDIDPKGSCTPDKIITSGSHTPSVGIRNPHDGYRNHKRVSTCYQNELKDNNLPQIGIG